MPQLREGHDRQKRRKVCSERRLVWKIRTLPNKSLLRGRGSYEISLGIFDVIKTARSQALLTQVLKKRKAPSSQTMPFRICIPICIIINTYDEFSTLFLILHENCNYLPSLDIVRYNGLLVISCIGPSINPPPFFSHYRDFRIILNGLSNGLHVFHHLIEFVLFKLVEIKIVFFKRVLH